MDKQALEKRFFIGALFFLFVFIALKVTSIDLYARLIREDGLLEYAQFVAYCSAAIMSAIIVVKLSKIGARFDCYAFCLLALALMFVAMEEISWGHSFFGLELPEYIRENNVQGDLTLHNLKDIQPHIHNAYILVCLIATIACFYPLEKLHLPLLDKSWLYSPNLMIAPYFLIPLCFYVFMEYISPAMFSYFEIPIFEFSFKPGKTFFLYKDQELVETFLAFGIMLHCLMVNRKLGNAKNLQN